MFSLNFEIFMCFAIIKLSFNKNLTLLFLLSYEPELHPGATYKIKELKATLKIFTTGSITITGDFSEYIIFLIIM